MLRPIIMIGCGGAGNKVVRYTRDAVERRLKEAGWDQGVPRAWQFIGIDTGWYQVDSSIPFLPESDFINLAGQFNSYQDIETALQLKFGLQSGGPDVFKELIGWRPNPRDLHVPISAGAGQYRAVGRTVGLTSLQGHLSDRIRFAFGLCDAGGPELLEVSGHLGADVVPGQPVPNPIVLIVGSMAGGTGAGIMLDVVDLVRSVDVNGAFPTLVALSPDIFGELQNDAMAANSAAFVSELLNAYWDNEMPDNRLIPPIVAVHTRGPHSVYVIGRHNLDGLDLGDSRNVYRAVGNVLAAITTSVRIQQVFHNYNSITWPVIAANNAGGYGFESHYLPGVVSSFGSATISVGRGRFREYMQKLLLRSVVEQLSNGFELAAQISFGDAGAMAMTADEKVAELAQRNTERFIQECGMGIEHINEMFVSNETLKSQLAEVSQTVKSKLPTSDSLSSELWVQMIDSEVQVYKTSQRGVSDSLIDDQIKNWSSYLYRRILSVCSEFSSQLSFPVVISMLELVRRDVMTTASELRERGHEYRSNAAWSESRSRAELAEAKGKIKLSSEVVQRGINEIAKSIVLEWSADIYEKLSVVMESVPTSMLGPIEAELQKSNSRISALVFAQDGRPSASIGWPKNDGGVPTSFAPSPVEFFLEDYTAWPHHARELIEQSLGNRQGLPIDPIEAARTLIIRGGFGNSSSQGSVHPLIWDEVKNSEPEWSPDHLAHISVEDSIEELCQRIDNWLSRPATEVNRFLTEGLASYLKPVNPITGAPVADHHLRLTAFREKLQLALMTSRPLLEIDESLNATVHPRPISSSLNIEGFPFPVGHPARQMTEVIIQQFLGTSESIDWAFTPTECESVLVSSFLNHPVNPSVISSITESLAKALVNLDAIRSHYFWQWRRARSLQEFVPLPYDLRIAAIRGFAVARVLGVMSAEDRDQNVIANRDGDKLFPKRLLTPTNRNNLLPALLEAMVLTFAEVSTKGRDAFAAYKSLIEYGVRDGFYGEFRVGGLLKHFIETGDYDGVRVVDQNRADFVAGDDRFERCAKIIEYLEHNIKRFENLGRSGPDPKSWRNSDGTVTPIDTLTHELLPDLMHAYAQVLDAVRKWMRPEITV